MKKFILIISLISISYISSYAQPTSDPVREVYEALTNDQSFPPELKKAPLQEGAKVEMVVQPDGKIRVVQIETGNETIRKYIETTINNLTLSGSMVSESLTYSVKILFKVL